MSKAQMVSARKYGDGEISLARAAREAGITLWEMMAYLRQQKVPAQYMSKTLRRMCRRCPAAALASLRGNETVYDTDPARPPATTGGLLAVGHSD